MSVTSSVQDVNFYSQCVDFPKKSPGTFIKILRDAAKWGDKFELANKEIVNLTKTASGLDACADFLSIKDIPKTAYDVAVGLGNITSDSENRWNHSVDFIENTCDFISQGCDVLSSVNFLGGIALGEIASTVTKTSAGVALPSFFIKGIRDGYKIYTGIAEPSEERTQKANDEWNKAWTNLVFDTCIFAMAFFTLLPFIFEGAAITSTAMLMLSSIALIAKTLGHFATSPNPSVPMRLTNILTA